MAPSELTTSVSRVIDAPAQELFDVVADPSLHHVIDGSGSVKGSRSPRGKVGLGDRFSTSMRIGLPYVISNKVVEFDEPSVIAWAHAGGWRWRYEFEADGDSTTVTETFDGTTARGPVGRAYIARLGWPERNVAGMQRTLERLDAYVTRRRGS